MKTLYFGLSVPRSIILFTMSAHGCQCLFQTASVGSFPDEG